jgi:drug/metabolite transporter (DMT)-like permease
MNRPIAVGLLVLCTALWGLAFVFQKGAMEHMEPLTFAGVRYFLGSFLVLPLAIWEFRRRTAAGVTISRGQWIRIGVLSLAFALETPSIGGMLDGWIPILYSGVCSTAIAFTLQAIGQQYVPPANAAIVLSAESLFAALGGALLLNERLPPIGYAGAAIIFIAIILVEAIPAFAAKRTIASPGSA